MLTTTVVPLAEVAQHARHRGLLAGLLGEPPLLAAARDGGVDAATRRASGRARRGRPPRRTPAGRRDRRGRRGRHRNRTSRRRSRPRHYAPAHDPRVDRSGPRPFPLPLGLSERVHHPDPSHRPRQPPDGAAPRAARREPPAGRGRLPRRRHPRPRQRDHHRRPRGRPGRALGRGAACCCSSRASASTRVVLDRTIDMVRADERPSEVLTAEVLRVEPRAAPCGPRRAARSGTPTPSATTSSPSASARRAPARATWPSPWRCRRCRPSRSTASSSPARRSRRGSGSASCPVTSWPRSTPTCGRSTTPSYDMLGTEGAQRLLERGHRRGGAARLHAGPHAQQQLHHPRRGAEHHARADEDVPHPYRLRVEGRRHRRRHPGRPARWSQRPGRPGGGARRHRRAGLRAPRPPRRRPPPHRAGHRRRLRAPPGPGAGVAATPDLAIRRATPPRQASDSGRAQEAPWSRGRGRGLRRRRAG